MNELTLEKSPINVITVNEDSCSLHNEKDINVQGNLIPGTYTMHGNGLQHFRVSVLNRPSDG